MNNTCTDKPNVHPPHPMSSNYNATLCCGYAPPVGLPTVAPFAPFAAIDVGEAKLITNLPMGTSAKTGCPPLGVPIDRYSAQTVQFVRVMARNLDKSCSNPPQGAVNGFQSVVFSSCNLHPRGVEHGIIARGDVTCTR